MAGVMNMARQGESEIFDSAWATALTLLMLRLFFFKKHKNAESFVNLLNWPYWYSLESSCRVLSDEYPYTRVSVIFQLFLALLY